MEVFRNDGHLSDGVLESLIHNGEALDELTRLEAAEHLAFCDQCLQRYTDLLAGTELLIPANSCQDRLWPRIRFRAIRLLTSRYATAAAAVALALTLLWGSAGAPLRESAGRAFLQETGNAVAEHIQQMPQRWDDSIQGLLNDINGFLEPFSGGRPHTNQGGTNT